MSLSLDYSALISTSAVSQTPKKVNARTYALTQCFAGCAPPSIFRPYRPDAAIVLGVPVVHLPADKHAAYGMLIFLTQSAVWHDEGKRSHRGRSLLFQR